MSSTGTGPRSPRPRRRPAHVPDRPVRRPGRGRVVPLLVVGVAVAAVAGTAVALRLRSAHGDPPLAVVERYLASYPDRDCEALMDLVTWEWWTSDGRRTPDEALRRCQATEGQARLDAAFEAVRVVTEDGDRAVVEIAVTEPDGRVVSDEVLLRRQAGRWRVDPLG